MKKYGIKLISLVLAVVMVFTCTMGVAATPSRDKGKVNYLSQVAIIEASNENEAKTILALLQTEKEGAFTDMIPVNLNKGGKKHIYLAYKTSTDVDDAITDLAIMNMGGNFSMGNYEQVLSDAMDKYAEVTKDYRVMAKAFAANYAAGNRNAQVAYRQMNLYYVEKDGVKTYMGDYMRNFPESDGDFSKHLFGGNMEIIANLRTLLAMGISNEADPLAARIQAAYAAAEADPSVYENAAYLEAAQSLREELDNMRKNVNNLPEKIAQTQLADYEQEDMNFLVSTQQLALDTSKAFLELLKEIPYGATTLGDYLMSVPVIEEKMLFPIVAAGTEAERLLMEYQSFYALLLYAVLEKSSDVLETQLQKLEAECEPLSVYHGVQNDMVEGTIGVTGDATASSASTGKSFLEIYKNEDTRWASIGFTVLGAAGLGLSVSGIAYLSVKAAAAAAVREPLNQALAHAQDMVNLWERKLGAALQSKAQYLQQQLQFPDMYSANTMSHINNDIILTKDCLHRSQQELAKCTDDLANAANTKLSAGQWLFGGAMIVAGAVMMGFSIYNLINIYNKFQPSYTDIPDNMVDVTATDYGDRFINYKNVPAYYFKDSALSTRENDLNGYDGVQWVSLYYTKNFEAGYCLTATADVLAGESPKTGYSPLHLFGRTTGYNTNSYCNRSGAEEVYLSFKYSTNQKSAVTDIPEVVGSLFSYGVVALAGFVGLGAGMGVMFVINKRKKKQASQAA